MAKQKPQMNQMMRQVQQMQEQMFAAQAALADTTVEGSAGGGMVKAVVTGTGELVSITIAPEVVVDNSLSNVYTVIEVSGLDREGLLFDLTNAISKLSLNIASAHIATFGEKAVDVFYVTDLTNAKIVSTARQLAIRKALLEVFEPEGEKVAATRARAPARA